MIFIVSLCSFERLSFVGLRCKSKDSGCCTEATPCLDGDGDCDNDRQCAGSLVCGIDNCPWGDDEDCCEKKVVVSGKYDDQGHKCSQGDEECCPMGLVFAKQDICTDYQFDHQWIINI